MPETTALTISDWMYVNNQYTGQIALNADKAVAAVNSGQLSPADLEQLVYQQSGRYIKPTGIDLQTGKVGGYKFSDTATYTQTNPVNSNAGTTARGTVNKPVATTINQTTGKVEASLLRGAGTKTLTALAKGATWLTAASVGITLGKTIDSALYNANPDFWDSNGMSSINPETWNSITSGLDYTDPVTGTAGKALNMILGLDPNTGETQAYIDQNAFAYMAAWLYNQGVFAGEYDSATIDDISMLPVPNANKPIPFIDANSFMYSDAQGYTAGDYYVIHTFSGLNNVKACALFNSAYYSPASGYYYYYLLCSDSPFTGTHTQTKYKNDGTIQWTTDATITGFARNVNDKTLYITTFGVTDPAFTPGVPITNTPDYSSTVNMRQGTDSTNMAKTAAYIILFGDVSQGGGVEGIGNQEGATFPDTTGWDTYNNVLPSLQQQYPNLWNNAIDWPTVQKDGTQTHATYIPITLPNINSNTNSQPISDGQTQQQPEIDPSTAPNPLVQLLTELLQQTPTDNLEPNDNPPEQPSDTGEGETPPIVAPTGNASALWAIYHPTQGEIDQFGAWLWSSNFIDQIQKIFNNPMESIIGLHKVYATPVDAGTSTIGVGYLDSGVSSAYIIQQYVDVNCGSINLYEQFGNVFDYSPFTSVKLYLPFVGIVNLDVAEVMRATISISYGVDVLTGACLARVTISRDGNSNVLYQYAGNCAVQYPLSMGSYMGIVSSIIGVAGSIAATVASGGSVAPLAIGAASAAFNAHTSVQNSGNFSGNAGAMGGKKPYLIVERPQTRLANNQESFEGVPTNDYSKLGNMSGFVKCRDMHLINVNATDTEINEIRQYLYNGIIV